MTLHLNSIADVAESERQRAAAIITDILEKSANLPPNTVAEQIVAALISAELLKQEQFYV